MTARHDVVGAGQQTCHASRPPEYRAAASRRCREEPPHAPEGLAAMASSASPVRIESPTVRARTGALAPIGRHPLISSLSSPTP
jgi:hypothetical protein